ncbi:MAG: DUF2796 domain-containing protein [Gammaproteobacteria bacterium]|nr:DUF2796 domain-containing protein [Gammaproteobacteria bacterium]
MPGRFIHRLVVSALLSLALPLTAAEHGHRRHGAHEHGAAAMNMVVEDNRLHIEFNSPAVNLVGFEHRPRNENETRAVMQAVAKLMLVDGIFVPDMAAGCKLSRVNVNTPLLQNKAVRDHDSHADFDGEYVYQCSDISKLNGLDVNLFKTFPGMTRINVQLLSATGQQAVTLTKQHARITLNR